jgi:hypothetical protein
MSKSLAIVLVLLVFALLTGGRGGVASAQAPDGASPERVQQQRAPAACPPDIEWGCVLSGSISPGLTLNSTSTANNSYSLYASVNNPGSGSAAVWGRVLGSGASGYGVYGSHQGSGYGVYGFSNNGIGFLGYSNTGTGMQGDTFSTGIRPGILGQHRATTGTGAGVEGRTNSTSADAAGVVGVVSTSTAGVDSTGVRGINNGTGDSGNGFGVWGSHASSGIGVYGSSPLGAGVAGESDMGTGLYGFSSSGYGVYGDSGSTEDKAGVLGFHRATTGTGAGVEGRTNSTSEGTAGVLGIVDTTSVVYGSAGVRGINNASGSGVYGTSSKGYGVYGYSSSSKGVYGLSNSGYGVMGESPTIGVYGYSSSGTGVSGYSNYAAGVRGEGSTGVYADGITYGVQADGNIAVYGVSLTYGGVAGVGPEYGVYGEGFNGIYGKANGVAGSRAAWFEGNVHVNGSFSVSNGTKNFRIDHPLDPENQYLQHAAIESSEVLNQYTGNVVLNEEGEAEVVLPEWFSAVNTDVRYQLTPIGGFAPLYIATEVQNSRFSIGGGTPGMKVSWLITAVRSDEYMQDNPFQVEVPKPEGERGTYLYPEGYGQPESRGVHYEHQQRMGEMHDAAPPAPAEAPRQ